MQLGGRSASGGGVGALPLHALPARPKPAALCLPTPFVMSRKRSRGQLPGRAPAALAARDASLGRPAGRCPCVGGRASRTHKWGGTWGGRGGGARASWRHPARGGGGRVGPPPAAAAHCAQPPCKVVAAPGNRPQWAGRRGVLACLLALLAAAGGCTAAGSCRGCTRGTSPCCPRLVSETGGPSAAGMRLCAAAACCTRCCCPPFVSALMTSFPARLHARACAIHTYATRRLAPRGTARRQAAREGGAVGGQGGTQASEGVKATRRRPASPREAARLCLPTATTLPPAAPPSHPPPPTPPPLRPQTPRARAPCREEEGGVGEGGERGRGGGASWAARRCPPQAPDARCPPQAPQRALRPAPTHEPSQPHPHSAHPDPPRSLVAAQLLARRRLALGPLAPALVPLAPLLHQLLPLSQELGVGLGRVRVCVRVLGACMRACWVRACVHVGCVCARARKSRLAAPRCSPLCSPPTTPHTRAPLTAISRASSSSSYRLL